MRYVDGFITPVPKKNLEAYRRISQQWSKISLDHGALECRIFVGDDTPVGKLTSFPRSVKLKPDETVALGWVAYKSRAHRDRVNKKVIADPRMAAMMGPKAMPFDGKRMIWGGFKILVGA